MCEEMSLKQVVEKHRDKIMKLPEVIGIAVGLSRRKSGEPCILIYTTGKNWPKDLPDQLEGYAIEIETKSKSFKVL